METKNQSYSDIAKVFESFLGNSKNAGVLYPKNVDSILNEQNSDWNFTYKFTNTINGDVNVVLFAGNVNTERYETVDSLSQVPSVQGGAGNVLQTVYPTGKIIRLNDNIVQLMLLSGESVDVVANQVHRNSSLQLIPIVDLYKALSGKLTLTTKGNFTVDFLREYVKHIPLRVYGMKIFSDNPDSAFIQTFKLKELNPFTSVVSNKISIDNFVKPESGINTVVDIPYEFYIGAQTFMSIRIPGNSKVEITLKASAVHSQLDVFKNLLNKDDIINSLKYLIKNQ